MYKKIVLVPLVLLASQSAFSATFSSQCANNQLQLNYDLNEGEVCSIEQTVTINGVEDLKNLENVDVDTTETFALEAGDTVTAQARLSCINAAGGQSVSSSSVSSNNGCNGAGRVNVNGGIGGSGIDNAEVEARRIAQLESQAARSVARLQSFANRIQNFLDNPAFERFRDVFSERFVSILDRQAENSRNILERLFQDRVPEDVLQLQLEAFDLEVEAIKASLDI